MRVATLEWPGHSWEREDAVIRGGRNLKAYRSKSPGYDCLYDECKHERKGEHGICSDVWHYLLADEQGIEGTQFAVTVDVFSHYYPATVPPIVLQEMLQLRPIVGMHVHTPVEDGPPCCCLGGRGCDHSWALLPLPMFERLRDTVSCTDYTQRGGLLWQVMAGCLVELLMGGEG